MSDKKLSITKKVVRSFLEDHGYSWNGKIIRAYGKVTNAISSDFEGEGRIVELTSDGINSTIKMEVDCKSFILYGMNKDISYIGGDESLVLYDELTNDWIRYLLKEYPDDIAYQNLIRKNLARKINRAVSECSDKCIKLNKEIEKVKNRCHEEISGYKKLLNEIDDYGIKR